MAVCPDCGISTRNKAKTDTLSRCAECRKDYKRGYNQAYWRARNMTQGKTICGNCGAHDVVGDNSFRICQNCGWCEES